VEENASPYSPEIQVAYNNFARGGRKPRIACIDQQPVFTQLMTPAHFETEKSRCRTSWPVTEIRRKGTAGSSA